MATYSVANIKVSDNTSLNTYNITSTTSAPSGVWTQSLVTQQYIYNLSGNTTLKYTNANVSTYNWLINAGTYSFSLGTASGFKTVAGTSLGLTGSFIMSGIYDGTSMWVTTLKNFSNL